VIKAPAEGAEKEARQAVEQAKASVRAFVEPPLHFAKNLFRHRKVRDRGWGQERASTQCALWPSQRSDGRAQAESGAKTNEPSRVNRWQRCSQAEQIRWRCASNRQSEASATPSSRPQITFPPSTNPNSKTRLNSALP
jgi:hypothetical protein